MLGMQDAVGHASRCVGADKVGGVPTALLRCPESFRDLAIKALITAPSRRTFQLAPAESAPWGGCYVSMLEGGTFVGLELLWLLWSILMEPLHGATAAGREGCSGRLAAAPGGGRSDCGGAAGCGRSRECRQQCRSVATPPPPMAPSCCPCISAEPASAGKQARTGPCVLPHLCAVNHVAARLRFVMWWCCLCLQRRRRCLARPQRALQG